MNQTTMPKDPQAWAQLLLAKMLPTPFKIGQIVTTKLRHESLPYQSIAQQLNNDPVLSFYIMNEANKGRPTGNPTSKTLDHAISMIGTDQLQGLIPKLPFKAASSKDISAFYFIRVLSSSLYAAHLGRAISLRKKKGNPEDVYWSSLFLGVPAWYLWYFATPEMRLVRYAIRSNFKAATQAESEVLGCTVKDIAQAVVQMLHLPDAVRAAYEENQQPSLKQWIQLAHSTPDKGSPQPLDDRDLSLLTQKTHYLAMLANMVAYNVTHDWYSRACLRSQRILASCLNCSLDEAIRFSHEVAADMSRAHPIPGIMLPAAKLFLPPRLRSKSAGAPTAKDAAKTKQQAPMGANSTSTNTASETVKAQKPLKKPAAIETKPAKVQTDKSSPAVNPIFSELTSIMLNRPEEFIDLHELMNAATQGIAYGLDTKRAMVALVNKDNSRLKVYYSVGCRQHGEMAGFDSPIVGATVFGKLCERPASLWLKPSSSSKLNNLVPMNFKQVIEVDEFFLMSVFVNKNPVAIFYTDNYQSTPMSEEQYKQFKYLCGAVSHALTHLANSKKPRA